MNLSEHLLISSNFLLFTHNNVHKRQLQPKLNPKGRSQVTTHQPLYKYPSQIVLPLQRTNRDPKKIRNPNKEKGKEKKNEQELAPPPSPMEKQWIRGPPIGHGSSATVYLATSATSGELFAVKSKELSQAGDLQREQSILCSLNSTHIISYLGLDISTDATTKQFVYDLFMEYAPGGSLSDEIKRNGGWLTEDKIRARTCEILQGLVFLHDQEVIHCDIKPRNVLIGLNGCAKIADFGCAKKGCTSKKEPVRGTPIFMAPEVARGEEQGKPADIWALGCTVIEMATGGSPWEDVSNPMSAMHRIGFSDEVPVVPSWLSEEAKDFLSKCLRRDWRERWSCKELLKHPFVTSSVSKQSIREIWVSPTSNLDQGFWESISSLEGEEEEEEEEEERESNLSGRIKALIEEFNGEPDWSWDDASWVIVRSNEEMFPVEEDCYSVTSEENQELLWVSVRNLERSFVSESSWENERWVLSSVDDIFCENDISLCNYDLNFKHELVDCVSKQEIQFFQNSIRLGAEEIIFSFSFRNLKVIKLHCYCYVAIRLSFIKKKKDKGTTWPTRQSSQVYSILKH